MEEQGGVERFRKGRKRRGSEHGHSDVGGCRGRHFFWGKFMTGMEPIPTGVIKKKGRKTRRSKVHSFSWQVKRVRNKGGEIRREKLKNEGKER